MSEAITGWNGLLSAKEIFTSQINLLNYEPSGNDETLLNNLKQLLNQDGVIEQLYSSYRTRYGKPNDASGYRMSYFKNQLIEVAKHNLEAKNGQHLWTKAVNQFRDMLKDQYTEDFTEFLKELKSNSATRSDVTSDNGNVSAPPARSTGKLPGS